MEGRTNSVISIVLEDSSGGLSSTPLSIVSWADGTDEEIAAMIEAHYAGTIDISDHWAVGDIREVSLSAISATTSGETQSAQTIELVIIGMKHDTLHTAINDIGRAAITVQTKNCLATTGLMNRFTSTTEPLRAQWATCTRRIWCNTDFIQALPEYLQNLIKPVNKYTNIHGYVSTSSSTNCSGYTNSIYTVDSAFMISEWELWGCQALTSSAYTTISSDGSQYEYMKSDDNKIKYLGTDGTTEQAWSTRTGEVGNKSYSSNMSAYTYRAGYLRRLSTMSNTYHYQCIDASVTTGIAPAFCL